jgi:fatty-acyl-CoA synthase
MIGPDRLSRWTPDPGDRPEVRDITCGDLLDEAAGRHADRTAIAYPAYDDPALGVRWTYAQLRARARRAGRAMLASGLRSGDRFAIWATNLPEYMLVQFGAAYAGVTLVPLNPLLRAREVEYILARSGARGQFVEPENRGTSLWDAAGKAMLGAPDATLRIALTGSAEYGDARWDTWLESARDVDESLLDAASPGDLAQIQFTSGTTGAPKGAALTHRGLVNNARMFAARGGLHEQTRMCSGMPMFHCGGCVLITMGTIAAGGTQYPLVTFDARKALDTIAAESIDYVGFVPTMLLAVEEEHDRGGGSLETVEHVASGGTVVPPELGQRWRERFGVTFSITYGMTEASPVITQSDPRDPFELQLTCGRALPHVEWDVVDPATRRPVALGEQGEVRTRGWLVMRGYFGDEAQTRTAISDDGWLATGDLGVMDGEGYLRITGRAKDVVIRGGENVYPAEVESAICEIAGVLDANVIGVPDTRYGEVCCAFVRLEEPDSLDADALRRALSGRIARFKIPTHIRIVDAFPLTPSGKVQKFRLREQFLAEAVDAPTVGAPK